MSNLPPRYITVHAAATSPSMDIGVDDIREWHLARGWNDIGYHFVIRRDGTLEKGRDISVIGAHVGNNNTKNIGICMAGGVTEYDKNKPEDNFTPAQYTTLTKLIVSLLKKYPSVMLKGHNDFPSYETRGCPCFDHHTYFEWIKVSINAMYKPDNWYDNSKYDWHEHSPRDWKLPENFYQEIIKIRT